MPHDFIKLTTEEFERIKPINNNVIIECVIPDEEVRPSGLIIVKDLEFFVSKSKESVEKQDQSAHLDRYGIVTKLPEKLDCKKMDWETELEIKVGDQVWFDYHSGLHCPIIEVEKKSYRILTYDTLIVAKRLLNIYQNYSGWILSELQVDKNGIGELIIPLNGYCLFEEISEIPKTKLIIPFKHTDKKIGIVKYTGNKNKSYKNKKKFDDVDINVEDKVIFRNQINNLLENEMYRKFSDEDLRYQQRADIFGVIN